MERDGVPTLTAVEEATGMAHRTLHRYRQEDESDYVQSSRRVDLWVMGYQRMVQSDGRWTLVPGPGPAATDATWNNLREIEALLLARAEELVQRERALAARETQVAALRAILGREAGGDWERETASKTGGCEIDAANHTKTTEPPFTGVSEGGSFSFMSFIDNLPITRKRMDKSPLQDAITVQFTVMRDDVEFLDNTAFALKTNRNELVRSMFRKVREEVERERSAAA